MEVKLSPDEFVELMGGEKSAMNFFDDLCLQIINEDKQLDEALSNKKTAFSVLYTKVETRKKPPFGLALMLCLKRESEDGKSTTDFVYPLLIYQTEAQDELPDCTLDMMSFQKRMNAQERIEMEWIEKEIEKFK